MTNPQANWVGWIIANRYKLEEVLGHGGMSTVYRATDSNLRRTVALKLIHPHLSNDPEFVQRFEREAAAVAQLRHPNIIQVYDFSHEDDTYYMVLEYLPGETLQDRLKVLNAAKQRLRLAETIHLMATVCEAVAYAHNRGMIHRDLKPANVMLNPQGQPILLDFGVAKMLGDTNLTATGMIIGTAKYMSPEQARGEHADYRTDIYSLGVILYEMITGHPPFEADSDIAILVRHVSEPVPDIRQIQKGTPDLLVAVVEKALSKEPEQRYQSADDMARALRAVELYPSAVYQPASSTVYTPSPLPPSASSVQNPVVKTRPPLWVIGSAVILVLLLLGLTLSFVFFRFFRPQDNQPPLSLTTTEATTPPPEEAVSASPEPAALPPTEALPSSEDMVRIDGALYTVGRDTPSQNYAPLTEVELPEFWLDEFEVTNAQYAEFIAAAGQNPPASWSAGAIPAGQEQHPVKGVTWDQADAYCQWANKRLPGEAEWEVAARGAADQLYPWGDDQTTVKLPQSGTYEVGSLATNRSPFGAYDMAGNVWEWVGDTYAPVAAGHRVLRGGENGFLKDMAYRLSGPPDQESIIKSAGIRCAADQVEILPEVDILYEEAFVDNSGNWPTADEEGSPYRIGYHPPDFYHVEVRAPQDHIAVAHQDNYEDATVETEVLVDHTDTDSGDFRYGLVTRWLAEDQYYAFTVDARAGSWQILKQTPTGIEELAAGETDLLRGFAPAGFTPDKTDKLRVDAQGPNFAFLVNDEVVGQVNDADYASGQVGFYVETFDETLAHLHYDSLTVRRLEALPESPTNVLYEETFVDTSRGWPQEDEEGSFYRIGYHPPDHYHVEVRAPQEYFVVAHGENFQNATVETEVLVDHTDTISGDFRYGLVSRWLAEDQYYAFTVDARAGSWQILKRTPAGFEELAAGETDLLRGFAPAGFTPDKTDKLRVEMQDQNLAFYINDKHAGHVSDTDYAEGQVGFYVETFDETLAHLHYDSLMVRQAETAPEPEPKVLYEEVFVDTNGNWPTEDEEGSPYRIGYHPPDFYHVEVRAPEDHLAVPYEEDFKDMTVETAVLVDHTDTENGDFRYGLTLRQSGDDKYYAFVVDARLGSWQVLKRTPAGLEELATGETALLHGFAPPGLTPDTTDKLRVDAQGSNFAFSINDEMVAQVNDADYASGQVGFYVETLDETLAHIHYDSLTVREVEPLLEPPPRVLYDESFVDTTGEWPEQDEAGSPYRIGYHPPDFYHVEVRAPEERLAVPHGEAYDDATVETAVLIDHMDTEAGDFRYGLILRQSGDDQYYAFTVDPRASSWQILKQTPEGSVELVTGTIESLQGMAPLGITPDKADKLRVDAQGSNFIFSVNDEVVGQVSDADYASGQVGFYVETFDETLAHLHYDSLTVSELKASPSGPLAEGATPTPTPPAGMALVPAGYFQMGSATGQVNETPEHPVFLDAFYLDLYEVTTAQYRKCVQERGCTQTGPNSATRQGYRDDPAYDNYPVISVTWDQADAYCKWAGKHLPTEAQWEYSASGPENFTWPWGNTFKATLLPAAETDTQPVGSYAEGISPFGVFDLAGNAAEWVADDYDEAFYADSPSSNPLSSGVSAGRVYRGGSYGAASAFYTTSRREGNVRTYSDVRVGFRCAQDAPEVTPPDDRAALVAEFCESYAEYKPEALCP